MGDALRAILQDRPREQPDRSLASGAYPATPSLRLFELLLIPGEERCFGFFGGHGAVFEAEFFEVVPGFADVGSGG